MPSFTDQIGRTIVLPHFPRRIISLVPSQTELLFNLGLDEQVVGITKFCIHPASWFRSKPRIGGTKAIDPARIDALQPDLIIANKEENDRQQVEALAARYQVWVSDVKTLSDALTMIRSVGALTGKEAEAGELANEIDARFSILPTPPKTSPAAYLIWYKPWMAAGSDTFIHQMLRYCGFDNAFGDRDRYPQIDTSDLNELTGILDLTILLSSESYPFRQRHIDEIHKTLPNAAILQVDGELFSWYGSRLLHAPAYFRQLRERSSTPPPPEIPTL
jgi:ABC-type Fe3+-hydroxamate transport system substrate-binding protein